MCACFLKLSGVLPNNFCPICSTNLVHTSLETSLKCANVYAQLSSLKNEGVYSQDQLCFLKGVLVLKQPNQKSSTNNFLFKGVLNTKQEILTQVFGQVFTFAKVKLF